METKNARWNPLKTKQIQKTSCYGHQEACRSTGRSTDRSSRKEPLAPVDRPSVQRGKQTVGRPAQLESKGLSVGRRQGLAVDRSVDRQRGQMGTTLGQRPGRPFWPEIGTGRSSGRPTWPEPVF